MFKLGNLLIRINPHIKSKFLLDLLSLLYLKYVLKYIKYRQYYLNSHYNFSSELYLIEIYESILQNITEAQHSYNKK